MLETLSVSQTPERQAPKPTPKDPRRRTQRWFLAALVGLSGYGLVSVAPHELNVSQALATFGKNLALMFLQPNVGNDSFAKLGLALLSSIALALVTTVIGAVIGLICGLASASNLAPRWVSTGIGAVMAFIRAIPTILWVLIYSVALGLGPNAAVVGLSFHSIAYLAKVYANSIEEIPAQTIEALRASGCGLLAVIFQAILPSLASRLLSWTFIRFEINFANAVVVGAAAGAGGIGYELFVASNFYFNFHEVGLIIYYILGFVFLLELVATALRRHVAQH